jgi:ankyrin repeat protein
LHYAAESGAPDDVIKALLDAGADPKAKDDDGRTPADIARENKETATASLIEQFYVPPTKSANFNL